MVRRLNEENGLTVVLIEQRLERCFHLADRILVMDKGRIIYDHHAPDAIAHWAVKNDTPFIPPLARLFAGVQYPEIPVTVKQGRRIIKSYYPVANAINAIKDRKPVLEKKAKVLQVEKKNIVEVHNLWFTYPNGEEVLKDVNLTIAPGEFVVVMGENGAGKTTLLKNINGLLKPGRGHVQVAQKDTRKCLIEELACEVGYLSQDPNDYLFLPSVYEELTYTMNNLGLKDDGIIKEVLNRLHLTNYSRDNPRDLSTGERQRVALASVLVSRPKLLLLDEPTRGLDYLLKEELGKILLELQKEGTAILIITHDVEFAAEYADRIILMADGTIVANGSKYDILTNSTFYSPQVSKLFNNIIDNVVTIKQGKDVLNQIIAMHNDDKAVPV
jgi:energy-coupling factor transport system ATP-binding protein